MSLSTTIRSARRPPLHSTLRTIIEQLRSNELYSAGKIVRRLIDKNLVSRSALTASREESLGGQSTALSIATLGARISLDNNELTSAVEFAQLIQEYGRDAKLSPSPTMIHVISGLIEVASRDSLSQAASILCSLDPGSIPHHLVEDFYRTSIDHSDLINKVWMHTNQYGFPAPSDKALVALLKRLTKTQDFGSVISLVTRVLNKTRHDVQSLPVEIPIEHTPEVITLAVRAGATQQSFRLWKLAFQQVGDPKSSMSFLQAQFFGDPGMTYALVRHFMKLAEKKLRKLQKWHTAPLEDNPNYFSQAAEEFYEAFAAVHGFNRTDNDAYMTADHYVVATSIACLFLLNRFTSAIDALEKLLRRNELPDDKDFGIILAALARQNAGRATQILLEAAPARIPGFVPTPYLYNTVLHHALLQGRKDEAVRVLRHARDGGNGSLEPKSLDVLLRSTLRDIESGWKENTGESDSDPSQIERTHLFKRVTEVLNIAQHHTWPSTARSAIETALLIQQPTTAWDIWMLAKKYRILGKVRVRPDGTKDQQDFGPGSAWSIAKGLQSAKEKGILEEERMWEMIDDLGIEIPEQAREDLGWKHAAGDTQEMEVQGSTPPISLRRTT